MKPLIAISLIIICLMGQSFLGFSRTVSLYPVFDAQETVLPHNFRTSDAKHIRTSLNFTGLKFLRASGSGQFSENAFAEILQYLSLPADKVVVVDLRQESHGFINGKPVSWTDGKYNYGNLHKNKSEVERDEHLRLTFAAQAKKIIINPSVDPTKLSVHTVKTERDLVENMGCQYIRLPVTDLNRPSNEVVDQFVEYAKHFSNDEWVHFHCKGGKGRTTTFMTLLDMMRNSHCVSCEEIIARQKLIGGSDLSAVAKADLEKARAAHERYEFVQKFYLYCTQVPNFTLKWSEWLEQQQALCANP